MSRKPGIEEIWALEAKCVERMESGPWSCFRNDEQFYELDFKDKLDLPVEMQKSSFALPTPRDMVDSFVDHVDILNARINVNKRSTSDIDAERAEMMRKLYTGFIYRSIVESDINPLRVAAKHLALYGVGVVQTVWDADRWPDKPLPKADESDAEYDVRLDLWRSQTHESLPIVMRVINPLNFMPDPSYEKRNFVFEKHKMLVYDIRGNYPRWSNPNGKRLDEEAELVVFWDKDYRGEWLDKEPLLKGSRDGLVKHSYGFIPYVVMESGLGNVSSDGKLEKRYVGLLRYMYDLLISESRAFCLNDIVLKSGAMPWGFIIGEASATVTDFVQQYGKWQTLPEGVKIQEMAPQVPAAALRDHMFIISDRIAEHASPRASRGLSEQGVRSGIDRRTIMAEAAIRYSYATEAFKNGTAKILSNFARIYKNLVSDDIRVWSGTPNDEFDVIVKKDMLQEPFVCSVEFSPFSEEDEYRRNDNLERLYKSGFVTKSWVRKQMTNIDANAMMEEEEVEKLLNDPAIMSVFSSYAQQRLSQALAKRQEAEMIQMGAPPQEMGQGTPEEMGGMTPTMPNRAFPGSLQEMDLATKKLRSQTPMNPMQGFGGGGRQ